MASGADPRSAGADGREGRPRTSIARSGCRGSVLPPGGIGSRHETPALHGCSTPSRSTRPTTTLTTWRCGSDLFSALSSTQMDLQRTVYGRPTTFNLPVYDVSVSAVGFGHGIDAVLVGATRSPSAAACWPQRMSGRWTCLSARRSCQHVRTLRKSGARASMWRPSR